MNQPKFNIGDQFKRTDYDDPKIYIVDVIRKWEGKFVYGAKGQGWIDGWAWIDEQYMIKV